MHPDSARIWRISSRPADDPKPTVGKDVLADVDFDSMEEYWILDLPGGEVPLAVLSEKGMQTEWLNIVEKEIQTEQCKLVNVGTQQSLSKPYLRVKVCKNSQF